MTFTCVTWSHLESLGQHPGRHCATWSTRLRRWYLESKPIVICCPKPESAFHRHNSSLSTIVIDNPPLPCAQKIYIKTIYNFIKTCWVILWIIHQKSCQLFMSGAPNGQVGLLPGFFKPRQNKLFKTIIELPQEESFWSLWRCLSGLTYREESGNLKQNFESHWLY